MQDAAESCRICGGSGRIGAKRIPGYVESDEFPVFLCGSCRTAAVSSSDSSVAEIYRQIYRCAEYVPGYSRYAAYAEQVLHVDDPLQFLADAEPCYWAIASTLSRLFPQKNVSILDAGCGLGYLTYALTRAGYARVLGVDHSNDAVAAAGARYPAEYRAADVLTFAATTPERFDAVVLCEVIEHLPDPQAFVAAALALLKPGGIVLLTTPDRDFGGYGEQLWATELPPVHLWWFGADSIAALAMRSDAVAESIDFTDWNRKHFADFWRSLKRSNRHLEASPIFDKSGQLLRPVAPGRHGGPPRLRDRLRSWSQNLIRGRHVAPSVLASSWVLGALIRRQDSMAPTSGYYSNARYEMHRYVPTAARAILDIGCGEGRFLSGLPQRDSREYWGIEFDAVAAERARQHLDRVFTAPVEKVIDQLPDNYFDCICLNDVLEHLVDPWSLLRALRVKLRAGGVIVASIPNIRHYRYLWALVMRGEWEYQDDGILDRTHLRFFTRSSMVRLFHETGYDVLTVDGLRQSRKLKATIWGIVTLGRWNDLRYPQFAVVASVKGAGADQKDKSFLLQQHNDGYS